MIAEQLEINNYVLDTLSKMIDKSLEQQLTINHETLKMLITINNKLEILNQKLEKVEVYLGLK